MIWLAIEKADKSIKDEQYYGFGRTITCSETYWLRDTDGRVFQGAWVEAAASKAYWWDWDAESPVDPVEFMPHPLDPRFLEDASKIRAKQAAKPTGAALPAGHTILEQAECDLHRVAQTVRIDATGFEYERIVHHTEAYADQDEDDG